jgi:Ni/Co efflux regulator RcnB
MKFFQKAVAFAILATFAMTFTGGIASAQRRYDNRRYVRHDEWRKGARMSRNDWRRGRRFDYRRYHLSAPPRGYEWREVDGNYVLAAAATGLIATIIAASAAH